MDIRSIATIKDNGEVVGSRTRVRVVKNKVAAPFREAEFDIIYGKGISKSGELIDIAANHGIVEKSGSWFSYGGDRLGQGRENAKHFIEENPDIYTRLEQEVRAKLGFAASAPGESAAAHVEEEQLVEA